MGDLYDDGDFRPDITKIQSNVWHGDEQFYVSTYERDSSALSPSPSPRYHETIAWTIHPETKARGDIVVITGDGEPMGQHFEVCRQLYLTGKYREDPDDE